MRVPLVLPHAAIAIPIQGSLVTQQRVLKGEISLFNRNLVSLFPGATGSTQSDLTLFLCAM